MEERKNNEELFLRIKNLGRIGSSNWYFRTVLDFLEEELETKFGLNYGVSKT